MSVQLASDCWLEAGCYSPLATGCCWQWRGIFLCSGGFCGVLCSRFSLSTPQRWPISGIRMAHRLPSRFSDSIGSRVPFTMEPPLGSSQCRLGFGSASSPGFFRSSRVSPFVLRSGCQSLLSWRPSSSSFFFFFFERVCFWQSLLTRLDLRVTFATWSPFGTSVFRFIL